MQDLCREFHEKGYAVVSPDSMENLALIRETILAEGVKSFNGKQTDTADFLDRFHERDLDNTALNEFRVGLIQRMNERLNVGQLVFEAFRHFLLELIGPDVAVQKSTNLVIQRPGDDSVPPLHRDAPPHSYFEVVAWVPCVDCYRTKGMYVLDRIQTRSAIRRLSEDEDGYASLQDFILNNGTPLEVKYGEALFFWGGLFHYTPINVEDETRWAVNLRYKNLFSPYGSKGFPDYFRILETSPLTRIALDAERERKP